jgi:uncharacterized membrane protein
VVVLDRRLKIAAIVLATLGLADATYLTYIHYAGIEPVCSIAHGCVKVQSSVWAEYHGVPIAVVGLTGYVLILGALLFLRGDLGRGASFGLSLFGVLYSGYLTYREIFSIEAICQWCVFSAMMMTLLAITTGWRLFAAPPKGTPAPPAPPAPDAVGNESSALA